MECKARGVPSVKCEVWSAECGAETCTCQARKVWRAATSPDIAPATPNGAKDQGNIAPRAAQPMWKTPLAHTHTQRQKSVPNIVAPAMKHDITPHAHAAPAAKITFSRRTMPARNICFVSMLDAALPMQLAKTM